MKFALAATIGALASVEASAGACTADDIGKINALPKDTSANSFGAKSNTCGHEAFSLSGGFDHGKFNDCMAKSVAISNGCSECYAAAGDYSVKNCKMACILGWCKNGCLTCTATAQQTAAQCSGVPAQKVAPCTDDDLVEVHEDRAEEIRTIRSTPGVLWQAGAPARFADQAPGASSPMNGVKGDWGADIKKAVLRGEIRHFRPSDNGTIPDNFDSETNWPECKETIGDIRDQSNCGCCWAFAGAEAASDRMCIASKAKLLMPLSAQDVCFCSSFNGCGGGDINTPWSFIKNKGAVTGGQYQGSGPFGKGYCSDFSLPHCHHHGPQGSDPYPAEGAKGCPSQDSPKCPSECDSSAAGEHKTFSDDKYTFDGQVETASGEEQIQRMIMSGGPVETAFTVYSDFENYVSGIYHHVTGGMAGGHAVKFVGWGVENGVKYWKVANSWNPYWGEKGYFRIKRGNNEGGIEDQVTGASSSSTWSKKSATMSFVV